MDQELEAILVLYTNKANQLFVTLSHEFTSSIANLDRKRDEQLFRGKSEQYVVYFRQKLKEIAKDFLERYHSIRGFERLSQMLSQRNERYVHQFVQKIYDR